VTSLLTFRLHGTIPAATGRELKAELRQAKEAGTDHRRAQKQFFAKFDAVLDRAPIGPSYFENEKMAEVLAGEIMMLEETGFTVQGFAILPNHAHIVLELPNNSPLSFAKAIDLLHLRTGTICRRLVRPKLPPEAEFLASGLVRIRGAGSRRTQPPAGLRARQCPASRATGTVSGVAICE
jgi:putative transposase